MTQSMVSTKIDGAGGGSAPAQSPLAGVRNDTPTMPAGELEKIMSRQGYVQLAAKSGPAPKRPVFLDLKKIRLPIAAIMSIVHRITGVVMVLAIPLLLCLLDESLASAEGFKEVQSLFASSWMALLTFLGVWALMHHLLAGIRYLLLDIDVGVDRPYHRQSAQAVLVAAPVLALMLTGGLL